MGFFRKIGHAISKTVKTVEHGVTSAVHSVGKVFSGSTHHSIADLPQYTVVNN